jgi:diketogulonate reductase-like aldo/keto reductase
MKNHRFGTVDRKVAVIGQGTWQLEPAQRARAILALRMGLDAGMTHIDTAEMYTGAEEIVGEAIAGRRDEVFLVSKVLPSNASRTGTIHACERSLAKLHTDHLDCYLLHWRGEFSLLETFMAFDKLLEDGKILSWGVSNFDVPDLEEALEVVEASKIACNQVLYHLKERAIEHKVLPWCEEHQVAVVGYSPFGQGDFSGPKTPGGSVLQEIADQRQATPRQVALAFLTRKPSLFTIPKASKLDHARENAGGGSVELTPADIDKIDRAFPLGPRPDTLPTL